jgi:peptide/nickel transport system permease protein
MLFWAQSNTAAQVGAWYWFAAPGICVALLGTSLVLLNFGIDEFINPRLRAAGLTRRQAKKTKGSGLPKRFELGLTPVVRPTAGRPAAGTAMAEQSQEAGI